MMHMVNKIDIIVNEKFGPIYLDTVKIEERNTNMSAVVTAYSNVLTNNIELFSMPSHIINNNSEGWRNSQFLYSQSETDEDRKNEAYRKMQKKIIDENQPVLYGLLNDYDYEMGYESKAEIFFNELYKKYAMTADVIMENIYLENMEGNIHLLRHMLFIIAELPKERRKNMTIIALAGLSNPDNEVKDLSIRCFEVWNEKKYIPTLRKLKVDADWLKEYLEEVIEDLEATGE